LTSSKGSFRPKDTWGSLYLSWMPLTSFPRQIFGRNGMRRERRSMTSSAIRHCPRLPMTPKPELGVKGVVNFGTAIKTRSVVDHAIGDDQQNGRDPGQRNGCSRLRSGRPGAEGLISRGVQTPLERRQPKRGFT